MKKKTAITRSKLPFTSRIFMFFVRHIQQSMFSLGEIWRNPISSIMTIAVLGVSLSLPSALQVLVKNAENITQSWNSAAEISLFIKDGRSEQSIQSVITRIKALPQVAKVVYISSEQALTEFQNSSDFGQALSYLDKNPLPAVISVTPIHRYSTPEGARELLQKLQLEPEVSFGRLDIEWLEKLQSILNLLERIALAIGLLLISAVVLIIGNTIRLAIMNCRDEIEIMKLVGATEGFIQRPFLYTGIWYGVIGGIVAWIIINILVFFLDNALSNLLGLYGSQINIQGLDLSELIELVFIASFLGWLGSYISVRQQLRKIEPA